MDTADAKKIALVQAFLFHYGEPVQISKVARALGMKEGECTECITALSAALEEDERSGLAILQSGIEVQLGTKPSTADARKKIIEEEWKEELTPAAEETASIIAYLGPIPKMMVDYIRGVNSGFILRNLLVRGLVEREPSKSHAHSFDYRISFDFLKHMGIEKIEDLPEYEKYRTLLDEFSLGEEEKNKEAVPVSEVS